MGSLSFFLTGHPPNDNQSRSWHWGRTARERKVWREAVVWAVREAYRDSTLRGALVPVSVDVMFHYKVKRTRDRDNLVASLKPVLDGLVDARMMVDDGPKWLKSLTVNERVDPKGKVGIYVTVTEQ